MMDANWVGGKNIITRANRVDGSKGEREGVVRRRTNVTSRAHAILTTDATTARHDILLPESLLSDLYTIDTPHTHRRCPRYRVLQ